MIVIGLTGHKRAGKNSVADILTEHHGFEQLSFAAALKDILTETDPILGIDSSSCYVRLSTLQGRGMDEDQIKASPYGKEYRRLLEKLGTEGVRKYDDNFWVDLITSKLLAAAGSDKRYVITDCRFPNEAVALRDSALLVDSVEVWEVRRPGTEPEAGRELHASEKHVGNMGEDFAIYNDGTLAQLATTVTESVTMLLADSKY